MQTQRNNTLLKNARLGMLTVGIGLLGALYHPALADVVPDPTNGPSVVANGDGTYTYTYNVYLLYPQQAESVTPGNTFLTFYDIDGLVSGSENIGLTDPQFASFTEEATGGDAVGQTVPDDPNFLNVTFQYTGPTQTASFTAPVLLGQVSFASTVDRLDSGYFTGQALGGLTGTPGTRRLAGNQGPIDLPLGTPEPGTVSGFVFTGLGLSGLMLRARKGHRRL